MKKTLFLGEERHTAVGKIGFVSGLVINMKPQLSSTISPHVRPNPCYLSLQPSILTNPGFNHLQTNHTNPVLKSTSYLNKCLPSPNLFRSHSKLKTQNSSSPHKLKGSTSFAFPLITSMPSYFSIFSCWSINFPILHFDSKVSQKIHFDSNLFHIHILTLKLPPKSCFDLKTFPKLDFDPKIFSNFHFNP